ncbi:MAG: SH3 domain-containing protein [Candidatus Omnitrophota bacterium]
MKKTIFNILLIGCVFIFSSLANDSAFSREAENQVFTGIINDNSVNIRSGPGVNFEILRKMDKDELVLVLGNELDWYKLKLPRNSKAYIHNQFIKMGDTNYGYINTDRVNVRAGKGTNFNVIGQLNANDLVEVIDQDNEWAQIFTDINCFAWAHKDFVNNHGPASIYISKENVNQEAWKLLQQAKQFEQASGITDTDEKQAACIQKYNAIIRDYPQTIAANSAKKCITRLSKIIPVIKKPEPVSDELVKNQAQIQTEKKRLLVKPATNPIAQGKVVESGRFFYRPGTHKLIENNQTGYFLKSDTIDLNSYIYHNVQIWGKIISSDKTKIPTIEVEYVNQLN